MLSILTGKVNNMKVAISTEIISIYTDKQRGKNRCAQSDRE